MKIDSSPKINEPPFSDVVRLRVLTNGEGLNVRKGPGVSQALLGTLPDAAFVTVLNGQDEVSHQCVTAEGCSAVHDLDVEASLDGPWWLYIRSDSGLEGWVSADYLVWAD